MKPGVTARGGRAWLAVIALVLGFTACALRKGAEVADDGSIVTLNVVNHNVLDITIYTVRTGSRDRLGQVTSNTTATFRVRMRQLGAGGDLRLFADPVGSPRGFTSDAVHVFVGQVVDWTLESDLNRSFLSVRN